MWNPLTLFYQNRASRNEFLRRRSELLAHAPIPVPVALGKDWQRKDFDRPVSHRRSGRRDRKGISARDSVLPPVQFPRRGSADRPISRHTGPGRGGYDAAADLAAFDPRAHLVIATVRATDQAADEIVGPLRKIRQANPQRPVLLAVTCLHDAYPGQQHLDPDPFDSSLRPLPTSIPDDLRRCLEAHYARFDGLFDQAVPIDLTPPSDGFVVA